MNGKMAEAVNRQMVKEFYSGYLYLQMAAWFEGKSLRGFAHWMRIQAQEEAAHAMILFNHLASRGVTATLDRIDAPPAAYKSATEVFEATLRHEKSVTESINSLVDLALEVKDHAARVLLESFVTEQVEEEETAQEILDKVKALGDSHPVLLSLDASLASRVFTAPTQLK